MKKLFFSLAVSFSLFSACKLNHHEELFDFEAVDPAFHSLINNSAEGKMLCNGFEWSEGPIWLEDQKTLIFSDVPANTIFKWTETGGKEVYLKPSGYTGTAARGGETGSNGLTLDGEGRLLLCQHGDRRIARMNASLQAPSPSYTVLADNYQGKKFNSPNDVIVRSNGDIFFTDPPYGLEFRMEDSLKQLPFQGVYKISTSGAIKLLTDTLTRPNGIAMMPDGKTLIIANSDSLKAIWYAYELDANDSLINPRIVYDASSFTKDNPGLPDGLKVDKAGNIFATGPGGIWVFDKSFKLLGKIHIKGPTANCAFGDNDRTLYITADDRVLRLKMR